MSLRWRIAAGLGAIAALVMAFGATAAYLSTAQRLQDSIDQSMLASAQGLDHDDAHAEPQPSTSTTATPSATGGAVEPPANANRPDNGFEHPEGCPSAGTFQPAAAAQRVAADGSVTACIEGGPTIPVDANDESIARAGRGSRLHTVDVGGQEYRVLTVAGTSGTYQIARSLAEIDGVLSSLRVRLVVIGLAGVGAAVLLGWFLARRVVKPVERLRDTAERIARTQDLTTPIPEGGTAEIGSLARSFTTMVDALGESRREQQQLVSDASHELRTPLTSLRTNAELLGRAGELEPGEFRAVVEGVQLEVGELSDLVSELVELATDHSTEDEPPEAVSLADVARSVAARATRRTARMVDVVEQADERLVLAPPQRLERAVANLVANALKYSADGTPVEVVVEGTRLEVRDRGRGIADEDLPHVFDRFYRSVEARTEPGSGLGLAIVKQTVERGQGRVWAHARDGGGAVVGFELPALGDDPGT